MTRNWQSGLVWILVLTPTVVAAVYFSLRSPSAAIDRPTKTEDVATAIASTGESANTGSSHSDSPTKEKDSHSAGPPAVEGLDDQRANPPSPETGKSVPISVPVIPQDSPGLKPSSARGAKDSRPMPEPLEVGDVAIPEDRNPANKKVLRREGTQIVQLVGSIVKRGDQVAFQPSDGSNSLLILENQWLERLEQYDLARVREGGRGDWKLSGKVTEYRGSNYLLVTSATLEESTVPSRP